jgi:hypothetical protein
MLGSDFYKSFNTPVGGATDTTTWAGQSQL